MKEMLNVITAGQAGNRIGKKFELFRVPTCYINSDSVDMRGLGVDTDNMFLLDGRGTGGSTVQGARILKGHRAELIEFLGKHLNPNAINMVVFGLGGGTGGSIGPAILDYLITHKYKTACLTVLPQKMLGILAGENAMKTLKQIKEYELSLFMLADNEHLVNKIGINTNWWERVNEHIVGEVASVFNIISQEKISQTGIGSIDKGELLRIMQYGKGLTDVRTVYLNTTDLRGTEAEISEKLYTSSLIEGYNYKDTLAYLVSIDTPQRGNYTQIAKNIFDITKKVSGSAISRLGMFTDPNLSDVVRVTMVNAGLKLPKVLQSRINNLRRDGERFIKKKGKEDSISITGLAENVIEEDFKL